jgi:hypothetical protein
MTWDWVAETGRVLDWLQEVADRSTGEARVLVYARDALRLVEWLGTQPARRVRWIGVLGSGAVLALVLASQVRPQASPRIAQPQEPEWWNWPDDGAASRTSVAGAATDSPATDDELAD